MGSGGQLRLGAKTTILTGLVLALLLLTYASPITVVDDARANPPPPYYIYGYVREANGTGVSSASVFVNDTTKGTSQNTTTDSSGKYQISSLTDPSDGDNVTVTAILSGVVGNNHTKVVSLGTVGGAWCNVTLTSVKNLVVSLSSSPTSPLVGQTVSFFATVTGGVAPFVYTWSFGDGSKSVATSVNSTTHSYNRSGTFVANVSVFSSGSGQTKNASTTVTVLPLPTLSLSWAPQTPIAGEKVAFTATLSIVGNGWVYFFAYGDGNDSGLTAAGVNSADHAYSVKGNYSVNATAYNVSSGIRVDSSKMTVMVLGIFSISLSIIHDPSEAGIATLFTAKATGSTTSISYVFQFGDGTRSAANPGSANHTYSKAGNYTVTVVGENATDVSSNATLVLEVLPHVEAALSSSSSSGKAPLAVVLEAKASAGEGPYSFVFKINGTTSKSQSTDTFDYTLTIPGTYTGNVTVTDDYGAVAYATTTITVSSSKSVPPLYATIIGPATGTVGTALNFSVNASGGSPPYTYAWSFGDGTVLSAGEANESHTFSSAGTFPVIAWVNDSLEHSYKVELNVTVSKSSVLPPTKSPFNFLESNEYIIVLVLIVIVAIILFTVLLMRRRKKDEEEEEAPSGAKSSPEGSGEGNPTSPLAPEPPQQ